MRTFLGIVFCLTVAVNAAFAQNGRFGLGLGISVTVRSVT
jgi:hypothetical protein